MSVSVKFKGRACGQPTQQESCWDADNERSAADADLLSHQQVSADMKPGDATFNIMLLIPSGTLLLLHTQ